MPRRNPTAGQYILSFLSGALPGYIQGKMYKQQQEQAANKPKELDWQSQQQIEMLKDISGNLSLSPEERDDARQLLSQLGFLTPKARPVVPKTPPKETSAADMGKSWQDYQLGEAKIGTEKARAGYYNRPRVGSSGSGIPLEVRERDLRRKELQVNIKALEQQRRELGRDLMGNLLPDQAELDKQYQSQIEKYKSEINSLGGEPQANQSNDVDALIQAMDKLSQLIGE